MDRIRNIAVRFLDGRSAFLKILLLGLLIRVLLLWVMADVPLISDAQNYHDMAVELVEGEHFATYWPPGLPLYEAGVIWVFGKGHFVARLAMLFWFVLLCVQMRRILTRIHSRVAANIAVLTLCLYPAFIFHSTEPLTQLPATALLVTAYSLLLGFLDRRSMRMVWYLGLVTGALILVRPSAALFVPVLGIVVFFQARKLFSAVLLAGVALTMVGMWIWAATETTGRFIMINEANARNFYLGNNEWTPWYKTWYYGSHWTGWPGNPEGFRKELAAIESAPESDRTAMFWKASLAHIGNRPDMFAVRSLSRFRTFFAFDSFAGTRLMSGPDPQIAAGFATIAVDALFFILIGIGWLIFVFGAGKGELSKRIRNLSYVFLLLYALPYFTSFSHPTYHMPVVPFLLIPAAIVMALMLGRQPFPRQVFRKPGFWIASSIFIAIQIEWILQQKTAIDYLL